SEPPPPATLGPAIVLSLTAPAATAATCGPLLAIPGSRGASSPTIPVDVARETGRAGPTVSSPDSEVLPVTATSSLASTKSSSRSSLPALALASRGPLVYGLSRSCGAEGRVPSRIRDVSAAQLRGRQAVSDFSSGTWERIGGAIRSDS